MTKKTIISYIFSLSVLIITLLLVFIGTPMLPNATATHNIKTQINNVIYSDDYVLNLTDTENQYLKENPVLRLGIDRSFPPFGSITSDNNYIGFSADFMRILEHRLNIKFNISKDTPWGETMEMAKTGQLDVISALVNTKQRS